MASHCTMLFFGAGSILAFSACSKDDAEPSTPSVPGGGGATVEWYVAGSGVTDNNGNSYTTIILNNGQEWMSENLRAATYANGDTIPNVTNNSDWNALSSGSWATYQHSPAHGETYGKLYNWYAVSDARNVCPVNWHVPTDTEWQSLEAALGMPSTDVINDGLRGAGENVGGRMKGSSLWIAPNIGATNESGFSGLPSGYRYPVTGFEGIGYATYWWSASSDGGSMAWYRGLDNLNAGVRRNLTSMRYGCCVRCLKD